MYVYINDIYSNAGSNYHDFTKHPSMGFASLSCAVRRFTRSSDAEGTLAPMAATAASPASVVGRNSCSGASRRRTVTEGKISKRSLDGNSLEIA